MDKGGNCGNISELSDNSPPLVSFSFPLSKRKELRFKLGNPPPERAMRLPGVWGVKGGLVEWSDAK